MKKMTKELEDTNEILPVDTPKNRMVGPLPLDVQKYQSHVQDFDLTEEQKTELLETLWSIMTTFVDLGFGVDSVQYLIRERCPDSLFSQESGIQDKKASSYFNRIARNDRG
jgi:hypothetical protein